MRTPPLLLGTTLLFWGWQSGFLLVGLVLGVALESARWIPLRWDFSEEDFKRLWSFCSVLFLAAAVYAFNANEGPAELSHLLREPTLANQSGAGAAGARTATALFRWMPMIFFLLAAVQAYGTREEIPWTAISEISRRRSKRALKLGRPHVPGKGVNMAYPYFAVCLFAACTHPSEGNHYFWGLAVLVGWALWAQRSRRFGNVMWFATFGLAMVLGFGGQWSAVRLQNYLSNLNPDWLGFGRHGTDPSQSRTALGRLGPLLLSGKIVIRLKTAGSPPAYLREATYRLFQTPFWSAVRSSKNNEIRAPEAFERVYDTNGTSWLLVPGKTNTESVQIACYLEEAPAEGGYRSGLLPLPESSGQLDNLPAFFVKRNTEGAVLAEGPGLVIFDAQYGPGPEMDSLPDTNLDLNVPTNELPAIDHVLSEMHLQNASSEQKVQTLMGFFQDRFTYSTWQGLHKYGKSAETPLSRFLLRTHSGHCEYFASATVLLLRRAGVSARYAVGFSVHEKSGNGYVVRQRDAHAWCRFWDERDQAWRDLDTTPASWIQTESARASPWQRLSDLQSWIGFQFARLRWGQSHLRRYVFLILLAALVLLLVQMVFQRKRKGPRRQKRELPTSLPWPGQDSEFYLIEKKLSSRGLLREPGEPLSAWLPRALAARGDMKDPLQTLLRLHYRYRFDPQTLDARDRAELRRRTHEVLVKL